MNRDEVIKAVKECIVDAVGVREEEIELSSQLVNDLGADSLDLVELIYLLETKFNISLQRGAIMERIRTVMPEEEFITEEGYISEKGREVIRRELPELSHVEFAPDMNFQSIIAYFTVEIFVNLIDRSLQSKEAEA